MANPASAENLVSGNSPVVSAEAQAVHRAATPIDLHADTTKFLARGYDLWKRHDPSWLVRGVGGYVDIPRMKEGNLCGQFFAMWTFPKPESGCYEEVHRQIDALENAASQQPGLRVCRSAEEVVAARANGEVAALLGIEGGQCLGSQNTAEPPGAVPRLT